MSIAYRLFCIFFVFFSFSSVSLAFGSTPPTTLIEKLVEPSTEHVEHSRDLLQNILDAPHMEPELYSAALKEVRNVLKKTWGADLFHAQFYCGERAAFSPVDSDLFCRDLLPDGLCFAGSSKEAFNLLKQALEQGFWEWDTQWIERPTLKRGHIIADWVKQHGAAVTKVVIPPCGVKS